MTIEPSELALYIENNGYVSGVGVRECARQSPAPAPFMQGEITSIPVAVLQDAERRVVGGLQKAMRDSVITGVGVVRIPRFNAPQWVPNPVHTDARGGAQGETEVHQLREAMGLLTTLSPQMVMNPRRPVEMAQQIVAHVTETIDTLRADLEAKKGRLELIERTDTAQENQRLHDRLFGLERVIEERDQKLFKLSEALGFARDERTYWMERCAQQSDEIGRLKAFIDHRDDPSGPVETLRTAAGDEVAFVITRGSRG